MPSQFEAPEALAKSYQEATQKISQQGQELAQVRAQVEQFEAEREQAAQPDPADVQQQWTDAFYADPVQTMARVAEQAAQNAVAVYQKQTGQQTEQAAQQMAAQNAYIADQIVASRHEDWNDLKGKVAEAINQDRDLIPQSALTGTADKTAEALERVYKLVKAEAGYEQQQAAGSEADQGRQQKMQAQTMSGAAGRPDAPSSDEEWWANVQAAAKQGYSARMAANGQ